MFQLLAVVFVAFLVSGNAFQFGLPRMITQQQQYTIRSNLLQLQDGYSWESSWNVKSINQADFTALIDQVVIDQLDIEKDELTISTNLTDLDADSVDVIAISTNIENELNKKNPSTKLRLPTEKFGTVKKYGDLIQVVYDGLIDAEKATN